ncbi:MAG: hypothetical protein SWH61_09675 [Thermodesulfobacteriota bacterium]|nr:hypothetical protein [Thermodesulfobacteriota bacterium]
MVQVDIVWSYAFGATFAACAARQLKKQASAFNNRFYVFTLLFLAILFAPSGLYLLWEHPQWETMQVARTIHDLPAWLVTLFAVTNITQGILGFWVSFKLIQKGHFYGAHANWMVAWIIFWFLLVCGWDCTGYQRFLYDMSVNGGQLWTEGAHMGLRFFYASRVWWTLVAMGLFFAPMLVYGFLNFILEGLRTDDTVPREMRPGSVRILVFSFGAQWVVCLGLAIVAALMVMGFRDLTGSILAGYLIGIPLFAIFAYALLFRRKMPMYWIARQLFIKEPGEQAIP